MGLGVEEVVEAAGLTEEAKVVRFSRVGEVVGRSTVEETGRLTDPQFPASGLHPVPQWSAEAPHHPCWEQHSDRAPSWAKPMHVKPDEPPQVPSGDVSKAPVGWGAGDEVLDETGAELVLVLVPQLPKRVLQPVPQWSI